MFQWYFHWVYTGTFDTSGGGYAFKYLRDNYNLVSSIRFGEKIEDEEFQAAVFKKIIKVLQDPATQESFIQWVYEPTRAVGSNLRRRLVNAFVTSADMDIRFSQTPDTTYPSQFLIDIVARYHELLKEKPDLAEELREDDKTGTDVEDDNQENAENEVDK